MASRLFKILESKHDKITLVLILLLASGIGLLSLELRYRGRFYPGIVIGEETVSGKTYPEALERFKQKYEELAQGGLTLNVAGEKGTKAVKIPLSRTGLTADSLVEYFSLGSPEETLTRAYYWGRQGSLIQMIKERLLLFSRCHGDLPIRPPPRSSSARASSCAGLLLRPSPSAARRSRAPCSASRCRAACG